MTETISARGQAMPLNGVLTRAVAGVLCLGALAPAAVGAAQERQPPPDARTTGASVPRTDAAGDESQPLTLAGALAGGDVAVAFRYRYEFVTDEAFALDAHASTLRTALGYETRPYRGFSFRIEAENVRPAGNDLYDNRGAGTLGNGRADRPAVADPGLTQINQATVQFAAEGTSVTLGRQEIAFDDQRFVGPVGWRQNHQSFDAVRLVTDRLPGATLNYALLRNVHRLTGAVEPLTGHLLNASAAIGAAGTAVAYVYSLDYAHDAGRSTATVGAEFSWQAAIGGAGRVEYEAEFALQRGTHGNPAPIDAGYFHLAAGGGYRGVNLRAGWERLGGSPARGQFNTPLATLHPLNGWADKFLVTPAGGLDDRYVRLTGDAGPVRWMASWHDFRAATGGARYGRELDLEAVYRAPWRQEIAVTAAFYDARGHSTDTIKLMVWTTFGF